MPFKTHHGKIEAVHHWITDLQQRAARDAAGAGEDLAHALSQLQTALEELNVAEEELLQQNEQLAAAGEALEQERLRYQELFEFAPDGYLLTAPGGRIQEANRAAAALLRVPQAFLVGKPLLVFVAKEDHSAFLALLDRLGQGEEIRGAEIRLRPRGEAPFAAAIYAAAARDPSGQPNSLRWLLHDITALKEAQRRTLEAEWAAAIGHTVAGLSHDSRNAMQRCQASLRLLALEVQDRPPALDHIGRIEKAQQLIHRLFEDVCDYATPLRLACRRSNLGDLWQEACAQLPSRYPDREIVLRDEPASLNVFCRVDPWRLKKAFTHLLDHTLTTCDHSGELTISTSTRADTSFLAIEIRVHSRAVGGVTDGTPPVPAPLSTPKGRDTALSLAIAKRIVEAHGGRIILDQGPGAATVLRILLPGGEP